MKKVGEREETHGNEKTVSSFFKVLSVVWCVVGGSVLDLHMVPVACFLLDQRRFFC